MDKNKDMARFILLLREQWDFTAPLRRIPVEIGGYTIIDAVSDVLNDHYGHILHGEVMKIVEDNKRSRVCPPSIM